MNIKTPKIFFLIFYLTKDTSFEIFKWDGEEIAPEKIQKINYLKLKKIIDENVNLFKICRLIKCINGK
ncbi:MAG: hypothetical protein A2042_02360 [Candidatus Schekmanbacteria bacterium GWA2_38_11]|uniref:Uncharacterized protein n=1 Tax=Candidatus Schekmanbacteria bacterium GWA2_38_11 TaxID=1817876 RepID=A0A1F7RQE2_9BACT|nr:MAG: hypothetical protein A2042_02360 [Candidatus Schekmanbacteria bacterium GWA2_38_11]